LTAIQVTRFRTTPGWTCGNPGGVQARSPMMVQLKVTPWHDRLRSDPRMQALLRRMRFP
jgi:hypothetical protein